MRIPHGFSHGNTLTKLPHFRQNALPSHSTPLLFGVGEDTVRFSGGQRLFDRYGIHPADVTLVAPVGARLPSKTVLLGKLLEAHEHGLKNRTLGNLSNRHYATNMLMENGQWGLGTNIENNRDSATFCGERSAMVTAWNTVLRKLKLDTLTTPADQEKTQNGMKVRLLAMSSGESPVDPTAGNPCSDCQNWLATDRYFSPETMIATLKKASVPGKYTLKVIKVATILPHLGEELPSLTQQPIASLPQVVSPAAQQVISTLGISTETLTLMMSNAQAAYQENLGADFSGKNGAAAVLLSDGSMAQGARFDWTARWFEPSDLRTAGQALQAALNHGKAARLQAIAYYGDDAKQPSVTSLGVLAQEGWGNKEMLVVVIEHDKLCIRTISDYMDNIYLSKFTPAIQRNRRHG